MEIYKILLRQEWRDLKSRGQTLGSPVDQTDGYIHFSTAEQLRVTAFKHFRSQKDIVVLGCDTDLMDSPLKWEPSRGGSLFPHLYGPIEIQFVLWHSIVSIAGDSHVFPEWIPLK